MMRSKPFYWIACDRPECDQTCPGKHDEIAAWSDVDSAKMMAIDSGWREIDRPWTGPMWLCPDHEVEYCRECGKYVGPLAGEQDYLCRRCLDG